MISTVAIRKLCAVLIHVFLVCAVVAVVLAEDPTPAAPADKKQVVHPPRQTYAPEPKFPKNERKAGHQGTVVLVLIVGPDGLPRDIEVSRALSPEFDQAAIDAVQKWKFSPATKGGIPVATRVTVEVSFHL